MKICVIQPLYSTDYARSDELFQWQIDALDRGESLECGPEAHNPLSALRVGGCQANCIKQNKPWPKSAGHGFAMQAACVQKRGHRLA